MTRRLLSLAAALAAGAGLAARAPAQSPTYTTRPDTLALIPLAGGVSATTFFSTCAGTDSLRDSTGYVRLFCGRSRVMYTTPHPGTAQPAYITDRFIGDGTFTDDDTDALSNNLRFRMFDSTGVYSPNVQFFVQRRKVEANRDTTYDTANEAVYRGTSAGARTFDVMGYRLYATYLAAVGGMRDACFAYHSAPCLLVDVHGNSHAVQRVEVGYSGVTGSMLDAGDAAVDAYNVYASPMGLARMVDRARATSGMTLSQFVRGPASLGARLVEAGQAAIPSPADPAPNGSDGYYNGGFTVRRYACGLPKQSELPAGLLFATWPTPKSCAIQLEHPNAIINTTTKRTAVARAETGALLRFLADYFPPSTVPGAR